MIYTSLGDDYPPVEFNSVNKSSDVNYLGKKKERIDKKANNQVGNKKLKKQEEKNIKFNIERPKSKQQMKIDEYFEDKNKNEMQSYNNSGYLQEIRLPNLNKENYTIYNNKNNKNIQRSKSKYTKQIKANPFHQFSNLLKEKQFKERYKERFKERYNTFIEKGIFTEKEISKVIEITKEYNTEINYSFLNDTDKLIKTTNYFLNKGFNENIRYIIYKCLINYGIPPLEKFNIFFNSVNLELTKKKFKTPDKMYILLYIEYINNFIKNELELNSIAKNKFIAEFFFNKENCEIVRSNLNFINAIKNNSANISDFLQSYLENNFDNIFKKSKYLLNNTFPKSQTVIIKILCNIVTKCEKIGFLNYKKIIDDYNIIFDGMTFKGNNLVNQNLEKIISKKLFGKELSEKKLKNAIQDYFLILVSNFHD